MQRTCRYSPPLAVLAVVCTFGWVGSSGAQSPVGVPPAPPSETAAQGPQVKAPTAREWPRVLKADPDPAASAPKRLAWTEAEIAAAQARCVETLRGLDVVAVGAPPIRESQECGAAAPVELVSVGKNPQVTFSPTVTVTCELAAALHTWITRDLQPISKRQLGAPLIRIDTMSSYSCRNAYGRVKSRLSEHGRANAIDIRAFTTAKADTVDLLADWGPTQRDIQAQIAAAKAAAQKAAADQALAAAKANGVPAGPRGGAPASASNNVATGSTSPRGPGAAPSAAALAPEGPSLAVPGLPGLSIGPGRLGQPSRLGGPKPAEPIVRLRAGVPPSEPPSPAAPPPLLRGSNPDGLGGRTQFLRQAHASACRLFGTVLGPESNNAHRNHFHVDLAQRNSGAFCE